MRMPPALGLVGEVTARRVAAPDLIERRMLGLAPLPRVRTAVAEAAAIRPGGRRRHGTRNGGETGLAAADTRHRAEQALGVRVMRAGEEIGRRRLLHDLAGVHDDHARAVLRDDA